MRKSILLAGLLVVAALAGCGSSPKANFYTLREGVAPPVVDAKSAYTIAIGAVTVPEIVDRPQFVVRTGANQVTINEFERWAGPLKNEIPRVIADNLTQMVPGASVFAYPQSANVDADCRILLEVQRFDSAPGEAASVEIVWTVRAAKGDAARSGRSVAREATAGATYEALVAAHGRALASASRDIAAGVQAVRAGAKP